jgi:tetratricopeptide (TPR) repeat protein
VRLLGIILLSGAAAWAADAPPYDHARELYQQTEYAESLAVLAHLPVRGTPNLQADILQLIGQNHFMLGDYKKATEAFEKALALAPRSSELHHWLGRAYGRRAETGSVFTAPGNANRARVFFEKAVEIDPSNQEAVNDLFDFYVQAPGFLGGGMDKAEAVAQHIGRLNAAEGHYAQAQLDDKRKQFDQEEEQLRRAAELAPREVGRLIDVAKYLARRGRIKDSDAVFEQAAQIAPDKPQLLFARAETYINHGHRLEDARTLLDRYLRSPLTPDDPPRSQALSLLRKIGRQKID